MMHYHADGRAEVIDQRNKSFLLKEFGTKVTWSSTDTSELMQCRNGGSVLLVR